MDAPVWSNDLLYLKLMILTIAITVVVTAFCMYISSRADKRRAARIAHGLPPHPLSSNTPQPPKRTR